MFWEWPVILFGGYHFKGHLKMETIYKDHRPFPKHMIDADNEGGGLYGRLSPKQDSKVSQMVDCVPSLPRGGGTAAPSEEEQIGIYDTKQPHHCPFSPYPKLDPNLARFIKTNHLCAVF